MFTESQSRQWRLICANMVIITINNNCYALVLCVVICDFSESQEDSPCNQCFCRPTIVYPWHPLQQKTQTRYVSPPWWVCGVQCTTNAVFRGQNSKLSSLPSVVHAREMRLTICAVASSRPSVKRHSIQFVDRQCLHNRCTTKSLTIAERPRDALC